jgi:ACR3 family arsenite transporter
MGVFERYLSVWVAISITIGVILGVIFPPVFSLIAKLEVAHVNVVVAVFIWVMIYPMMVQVDFSTLKKVGKNSQGLVLTLVINWLIKPFSMAVLGWLFFEGIFANFVSPETAQEYIAGMILLGVAPCTAMVFVWSQLTKGDANYTLVQVSVNDIIMIFAFAPIAGLLLGVSNIHVPWNTLVISVVLYVLLPLIAGILTRKILNSSGRNEAKVSKLLNKLKPFSVMGLLATVVLLFGFQANTIIEQPVNIVLIAIPLILQTYGIFIITFFIALKLKLKHSIAAPSCLIGTSNFFELAVAVAISLFGLHSGAALATIVGVLVEVPVMLSLVVIMNKTRHWFT